MTPQQKKLAIIISAIVGVLALLGIAYAVVNSTVFSADNTAKSYLSAIASGDYDKANGISDPQVANGKRTLLTNAASKGDKTTISNQRISPPPTTRTAPARCGSRTRWVASP